MPPSYNSSLPASSFPSHSLTHSLTHSLPLSLPYPLPPSLPHPLIALPGECWTRNGALEARAICAAQQQAAQLASPAARGRCRAAHPQVRGAQARVTPCSSSTGEEGEQGTVAAISSGGWMLRLCMEPDEVEMQRC